MLSRVRNHFQGAKFARMSSGTYCVIRDLGLVKGGKGMRHHEVLFTFSLKACVAVDGTCSQGRAQHEGKPRLARADVGAGVGKCVAVRSEVGIR